jgi:hypothetical protein
MLEWKLKLKLTVGSVVRGRCYNDDSLIRLLVDENQRRYIYEISSRCSRSSELRCDLCIF